MSEDDKMNPATRVAIIVIASCLLWAGILAAC